jgi:hypothetical protein
MRNPTFRTLSAAILSFTTLTASRAVDYKSNGRFDDALLDRLLIATDGSRNVVAGE